VEPDVTIVEMQARLVSEASVSAFVGTMWTFLDRNGLRSKKTAHAYEQDRLDVLSRREAGFDANSTSILSVRRVACRLGGLSEGRERCPVESRPLGADY
jgi:hypothetical protein